MRKSGKVILSFLLSVLAGISLVSCNDSLLSSSTSNGDESITAVYEAYVNNGGTLSYEDWLATIKGEKGDKGDAGATGVKGDKGDTGAAGKDGTSFLTGVGEPASTLGKDGDSYIDTDTFDYWMKSNGQWSKIGNIKGNDSGKYHQVRFHLRDREDKVIQTVKVKDGGHIKEPLQSLTPGYDVYSWFALLDETTIPENESLSSCFFYDFEWNFLAYSVGQDLDLYASYSRNYYTITMVDETLGIAGGEQRVGYNTEYSLPSFSKYFWTFAGWADENGVMFDSAGIYALTSDIKLHAVWKENPNEPRITKISCEGLPSYFIENCEIDLDDYINIECEDGSKHNRYETSSLDEKVHIDGHKISVREHGSYQVTIDPLDDEHSLTISLMVVSKQWVELADFFHKFDDSDGKNYRIDFGEYDKSMKEFDYEGATYLHNENYIAIFNAEYPGQVYYGEANSTILANPATETPIGDISTKEVSRSSKTERQD